MDKKLVKETSITANVELEKLVRQLKDCIDLENELKKQVLLKRGELNGLEKLLKIPDKVPEKKPE